MPISKTEQDIQILNDLLNLAVRYGKALQVDWLLRQGANPEGDGSGFSPLYYACLQREIDRDRVEIVELLVKAGADVNRVTASSSNVAIAARRGRADVVESLLRLGADPYLTFQDFDDGQGIPLERMARHLGHDNVVAVIHNFFLGTDNATNGYTNE
jgi:ankyrin repeat protein